MHEYQLSQIVINNLACSCQIKLVFNAPKKGQATDRNEKGAKVRLVLGDN